MINNMPFGISLSVTEPKIVKTMFVGDFYKSTVVLMLQLINGFEIVGMSLSGEEAINMYSSVKPDVIFVNVLLEGMSGFEMARFIREQNPDIKIIILSESFTVEFLRTSMEMGLEGYLPKDVDYHIVEQAIEKIKNNKRCFDAVIAGPF